MSTITQRFTGKVVVVTGAASGIGAAGAERFAAEGAQVACLDIDAEGAAAIARRLDPEGASTLGLRCDITDEDEVAAAFMAVEEAWGPVDVVFANAGIEGPVMELPDVSVKHFRRVIDVNLTGTFLTAKHAIASMRQGGGGVIIVTASVCSHIASPLWGAYTASKAGVLGLVRSLAIDHAAEGIRVAAVSPNGVRTPLMDRGLAQMGESEEAAEAALAACARPEDIASAVAFLASDDARLVGGTSLLLDEGFTAA